MWHTDVTYVSSKPSYSISYTLLKTKNLILLFNISKQFKFVQNLSVLLAQITIPKKDFF